VEDLGMLPETVTRDSLICGWMFESRPHRIVGCSAMRGNVQRTTPCRIRNRGLILLLILLLMTRWTTGKMA